MVARGATDGRVAHRPVLIVRKPLPKETPRGARGRRPGARERACRARPSATWARGRHRCRARPRSGDARGAGRPIPVFEAVDRPWPTGFAQDGAIDRPQATDFGPKKAVDRPDSTDSGRGEAVDRPGKPKKTAKGGGRPPLSNRNRSGRGGRPPPPHPTRSRGTVDQPWCNGSRSRPNCRPTADVHARATVPAAASTDRPAPARPQARLSPSWRIAFAKTPPC
jgi:hypothetical protein